MKSMTVWSNIIDEWDSELKEFERLAVNATQPEPVRFKDDPVALAWASYRRFKDHGSRWVDLNDVTTIEEDYVKSAEIRKYYADRILISILTNKTVSEFRKKLYGVVSNSLQLSKNDIGLLHRLPYFYEEDLAIDRVVQQTEAPVNFDFRPERITADFSVIERVFKTRRIGEYTQFWLRSDRNAAPFMLTIKSDNPYYKFVTKILERPVTLSGIIHLKRHQGHHRELCYYNLSDIELV